jgi:hypothetical protein
MEHANATEAPEALRLVAQALEKLIARAKHDAGL